ncbi:MAG: S24 family peptidase [Campylobacterota bacterium]
MKDFSRVLSRMKEFIEGEKITDKSVASLLGVKPEYLSRCKATGHIPYEKVVGFCRQRGLDLNYILFGNSAGVQPDDDDRTVRIKLLHDVFGSCGGGGEVVSDEHEWLRLDKTVLNNLCPTVNPRHLESIKAVGDSMEPAIKDGAIVFFDKNDTNINKAGIFALRSRGGIFIKRVFLGIDGSVELISQNSIYPPERVDIDEIFIIGRVLGTIERV